MGKLRRLAAAALCGAVFAGGVLAVAAACAACAMVCRPSCEQVECT